MGNTSEGAKKGVATKRAKYGKTHFEKIGAEGGRKSGNRPMRDPEYASKLANIRWAKVREARKEKTNGV